MSNTNNSETNNTNNAMANGTNNSEVNNSNNAEEEKGKLDTFLGWLKKCTRYLWDWVNKVPDTILGSVLGTVGIKIYNFITGSNPEHPHPNNDNNNQQNGQEQNQNSENTIQIQRRANDEQSNTQDIEGQEVMPSAQEPKNENNVVLMKKTVQSNPNKVSKHSDAEKGELVEVEDNRINQESLVNNPGQSSNGRNSITPSIENNSQPVRAQSRKK